MSFSSDVKEELCRNAIGNQECALAECTGVLLCCNTYREREIRIVTSGNAFAARLPKLWQKAYGCGFDERLETESRIIFTLTDPAKLAVVFSKNGFDVERHHAHHVNLALLESAQSRKSFLRGVFLAGGSMTDPLSGYHMELVTEHVYVARELAALLEEEGFPAGSTVRNGRYVLYFKNSESISDVLTAMGASVSAMQVMNAKITKSMKNSVNRILNCDEANADKTVAASEQQLAAIRRIEDSVGLDSLSTVLRETARLRIDNPELSISQLAELSNPPVTKSCLNHRLRKLIQLAGM